MLKKLIAIRNNDSLTLLYNGKHYSFTGERVEPIYAQYVICKSNPSEENFEILDELISPIKKYLHAGIIEQIGDQFFLKDTNIPMPDRLATQIIEFSEQNHPVEPLIRFWKLCMLNPNEQARNDFFEYCDKFGIVITDNGYAVLYKAVNNNTSHNAEWAKTVAKYYAKVKRWKKSASKFILIKITHEDDTVSYHLKPSDTDVIEWGYSLLEEDSTMKQLMVWDLQKAYESLAENISDEDAFTPIHSGGDYGNIIRIGEPVKMPREECDPDINADCSYGLHVGATTYVQHFGYGSSVLLACLVNPMNVVALPKYDHSKIRVCEYYPYAVLEKDENGTLHEISEESYWEEDYKDYEDEIFDKFEQGDFSDDPEIEEQYKKVYYREKFD